VVASEAITVGKTAVTLPGIGSYVAQAIQGKDLSAIGWALLTMLIVILIYDQLLFRPLVAWAEKFKFELTESQDTAESWVLTLFQRTRFLRKLAAGVGKTWTILIEKLPKIPRRTITFLEPSPLVMKLQGIVWYGILIGGMAFGGWILINFVCSGVDHAEISKVFILGLITLGRVMVLLVLASLIWVPLGIIIGLNPRWATKVQPLAQFLAAFPANLLFPIAVFLMVRYRLSPEIWTAPLMILGTQWYILFNVIAGAAAIPTDLREAAQTLGLSGWRLWKYLLLPGILPSLITGLVTASGGTWNASIVAEVVSWGSTTLTATGLGSYIAQWTEKGDYPHIVLGIAVMSLYVVCINRFFWRRLYTIAQTRYRLD
jgi:NitT/TauT family transport system permease protein